MLPAWETAWERRAQLRKDTAAQLHNYKLSRPELYAVTTAPATPVHHYAEYDPADAIYYVWESGMFDCSRVEEASRSSRLWVVAAANRWR